MKKNCCKGGEIRCECGSLVAILTVRGIEVKCRRCKRLVLIPIHRDADFTERPETPES